MISILIPTRNRVSLLERWFKSLEMVTNDPSVIEIVIKVDHDDMATQLFLCSLKTPFKINQVLTDKGKGFLDIPRYTNALASVAKGDWFVLIPDDHYIMTYGWEKGFPDKGDTLVGQGPIIGYTDKVQVAHSPHYVHRKWYDILGFISPEDYCYNDLWIYAVAHCLKLIHESHMVYWRNADDVTDESLSERHKVETLPDDDVYEVKQEDYEALKGWAAA